MNLERMNTDEQLQAAINASLQTHQQETQRRSIKRDDYIASKLPNGWEQRKDPRSGKVFYIDHNTRTTHWEPPNRPLPPGWERKLHEKSGRHFYIDHNTRHTSWDPPEIPESLFNHYQEQQRQQSKVHFEEPEEVEEEFEESQEDNDNGLKPRKTSTDFDKECCICFDADVNVMTPCFHKFCRDCAEQLDECALCRKPYNIEDLTDLRFTKRSIIEVPTYQEEVQVEEQNTFYGDNHIPPEPAQPVYNPYQQPVHNPYAQPAPPVNAPPAVKKSEDNSQACCIIS